MSRYPGLDAVVEAMTAHGGVRYDSYDIPIDPERSVPDTTLFVSVEGADLFRSGSGSEYTHCIHRYAVIGGEDITWVSPHGLGSTTRGAFGQEPADDDVISQTWEEILRRLNLFPDPHAR